MELALRQPAGDVEVRVGRVELTRAQPGRVHHQVAVVDHRHQPGMVEPAVVALEVVLERDLPVRADLVVRAVMEAQRADVEAAFADDLRKIAERLLQRLRAGIRIDEHERAPGADRHRHQPEPVELEARLGARGGAQAAVQPVGPCVVWALQGATLGRAGRHDRAAMAADVDERAQDVVAVAREHDREAGDVRGGEAARRGQLVAPRGVLPRAPEDRCALARLDLGVRVPGPGERARRARRVIPARGVVGQRAHPPSRAISCVQRRAKLRSAPSYAASSVVT